MDGDGSSDFVQVAGTVTGGSVGIANTSNIGGFTKRVPYRTGRLAARTTSSSDLTSGFGSILWYVRYNPDLNRQFGLFEWGQTQTDFLTPADFDGDKKADIAVWRASSTPGESAFYIINSSSGTVSQIPLGESTDLPTAVADYDGDHIDDPAVYHCPTTTPGPCFFEYIGSLNNPGGAVTAVEWGFSTVSSVFPVPGDYDGDGKADFCVYGEIPNSGGQGAFWLHKSGGTPNEVVEWGAFNQAIIVPGDFDGDGKSDFVAVGDLGGSLFHYILTRKGQVFVREWGASDAIPTPGDYDGDGKDDIAVWGPSGLFYVLRSSDGQVQVQEWGSCASGPCPFPAAAWQVLF
jgi:hypothetical protein